MDLDVVRKSLGLYIRRRQMPEDTAGCIAETPHRHYVVVNAGHAPERQRFTVAHEICEFLVGRYRERTGKHLVQGGVKEQFCNRFAAELLMPADAVRSAADEAFHDRHKNDKTAALAHQFRVSAQAMSIRLWELEINRRKLTPREGALKVDPEWDAHLKNYAKQLKHEFRDKKRLEKAGVPTERVEDALDMIAAEDRSAEVPF